MAETTVKVSFVGDSKDLNRAIDDVDNKTSGLKSSLGGLGKVAATVGIAALGTELFAAGKAFAEDEKAAASLALTLKNNVASATDESANRLEKWINKTQNATGVLDDELRPALDSLIRGTKDLDASTELLTLAMDISAGTGKDLGSTADALSKAFNGNMKPLKALDPALAALIKEGAGVDEVFGELSKTFAGQTAAAADTTAGKIAIAKARFSDLQEEIGAKVVPAMAFLAEVIATKVIPIIEGIVGWLEEHEGVAKALGIVVGVGLVAAFIAWAAAAAAAAAATIAATWPIIAIIAALAALVAGVIYAYTHWGWFKDAVDAVARVMVEKVWPAIQMVWDVLLAMFGWLQDHWKLVLAILTGPIGAAVIVILDHWDTIKNGFNAVVDFFVAIGNGLYNAIIDPFVRAFKWIKDLWDDSIGSIVDKVSSFGSKVGGAIGKLPGFAAGGVVGGPIGAPQLAVVHGGERIIPNGGGGSPTTVQLNIDGRSFMSWLVDYSDKAGGVPIRTR